MTARVSIAVSANGYDLTLEKETDLDHEGDERPELDRLLTEMTTGVRHAFSLREDA